MWTKRFWDCAVNYSELVINPMSFGPSICTCIWCWWWHVCTDKMLHYRWNVLRVVRFTKQSYIGNDIRLEKVKQKLIKRVTRTQGKEMNLQNRK